MAEETFATFIEKERARLKEKMKTLNVERKRIDGAIAEIEKEMEAIAAYEAAKKGSSKRKGSRRAEVLEVIRKSEGSTRAGVIESLGLKGNKSGEQSISNALAALKKAGKVVVADGVYVALEE
jgi:hypothetical protein